MTQVFSGEVKVEHDYSKRYYLTVDTLPEFIYEEFSPGIFVGKADGFVEVLKFECNDRGSHKSLKMKDGSIREPIDGSFWYVTQYAWMHKEKAYSVGVKANDERYIFGTHITEELWKRFFW